MINLHNKVLIKKLQKEMNMAWNHQNNLNLEKPYLL